MLSILLCAGGGTALGGRLTAQDLKSCPSCFFCGMDRKCFAYSRVVIRYDDRSTVGACSINCAALDLAKSIDRTPVKLLVGDYKKRSLIDAERAVWIIGGDKPGVMSERAKWAFASRRDAEEYIRKHGGALAGFDEVMIATYLDIYRETVK
ncbi:MAG TPA: nitrous oxide reductase accessory protein NosL [Syntrophobacteraceae bacterium]|nr:nitrous oxide reductase accessory protein NosL [Syntrophobacteraceae bacterium]